MKFSSNGLRTIKSLVAVCIMIYGTEVYNSLILHQTLIGFFNKFFYIVTILVFLTCVFAVYWLSSIDPQPEPIEIEVPKFVLPPRGSTYGYGKRHGYVYVVDEINGSHYKIGRTSNPYDRLKTFSVKLPFKIDIEILLETDDMHYLERFLHRRFASKRVSGEWFELSQDDLDYIQNLAKGQSNETE